MPLPGFGWFKIIRIFKLARSRNMCIILWWLHFATNPRITCAEPWGLVRLDQGSTMICWTQTYLFKIFFKNLGSVRFFQMFLKEDFVKKGCIFFNQNGVKKSVDKKDFWRNVTLKTGRMTADNSAFKTEIV